MRLLLDTHAFLWFVAPDPRLSGSARALIADPANEKLISPVSYWELAIKSSIGKLILSDPIDVLVPRALIQNGFTILPIAVAHAATVATLPFHHRDPFDRMLAAQALTDGLPLVSADPVFDAYGLSRLW